MKRKSYNAPSRGMTTCGICGRDFALIEEEHYVARSNSKTGIAALASGEEPNLYDVIDCPHCGCQKTLQVRLRISSEMEEVEENNE